MNDHDDLPPCRRCRGTGHVSMFLYDDGYEAVHGDVDCDRCGGGGTEPDPDALAEARATNPDVAFPRGRHR